ncbi:hypothetical protein ACIBAG_13955 [Streptomyces sp. NPDC051243]|uniref:hypothetical protein n=1 Tax=Streptomyces sp. NPDC051243 TaxID=3365646 RepID=UPI0037B43ED6
MTRTVTLTVTVGLDGSRESRAAAEWAAREAHADRRSAVRPGCLALPCTTVEPTIPALEVPIGAGVPAGGRSEKPACLGGTPFASRQAQWPHRVAGTLHPSD